ncbi:unnamed protein product [Adineta steineri]|uniref:Uncharacterized protein n=1 Tax=Adineta steineri TaxID=433720 RepID=A0A814MEM5_9BILA|nr:unnamed protein product [Adineta steineri]CAF3593127.1 unnamed protein product [Adineta steineri]
MGQLSILVNIMLNTSNVAHSILTEEIDNNYNSNNNNNNNNLLLNDFSFHNDDIIINGSLHYGVYDTALFDVLKVDPEDFASQITLMDLPIFKSITPDELISCSWSSKSKLEKAFHIVQFTRRFNQVNFWTQGELLRADIVKNRIEILSHFIRIAKKLFELNNINACMAVVMALQSAPIYRLQKTWMGLSKRDRSTFTGLKDLVSSNENWKRLRNHLTQSKLPCIPYLGIYLTDIIHIDTLHPHRGGLETNQRKNAMNNICRVISEFQQSTYDYLKSIECVQSYLSTVRYMEELQTFVEAQNYEQSLRIEPDDQIDSCCDKTIKNLEKSASFKILQSTINSNCSHRRTLSDFNHLNCSSSTTKSATLPCRTREKKSLLDDSLLVDPMTEETRSSSESNDSCEIVIRKTKEYIKTTTKHHHIIQGISLSLSSLSMKEPLNPHNDPLITSNYNFEGLLERKCLLKNYKKPNITKWKKYWVAICEHLLFFHKQKSFLITFHMRLHRQTSLKDNDNILHAQSPLSNVNITLSETDRLYYRENPSKCQSITDCLIVLSQTKNRNEIQLSDLNRGSMYKFRFENAAVANIWYQHLKEASIIKQNTGRLSENLIALD